MWKELNVNARHFQDSGVCTHAPMHAQTMPTHSSPGNRKVTFISVSATVKTIGKHFIEDTENMYAR